ncbi:MAG: hypothetical protein MJZ37_03190 [Bacilli bacterium]|nr:hypothetical protein [Bacilli bacterium]
MRLRRLIPTLCACLVFVGALSSCGNKETTEKIVPDYVNAELFESALNAGEDTIGKTVCFVADTIKPDSAFGFNIWAGEHLNFISETNPGVKEGDNLTVTVGEVENFLGSWLIKYDLIYID